MFGDHIVAGRASARVMHALALRRMGRFSMQCTGAQYML